MAAHSRTAKFYAANPEARKKKSAYDQKYNKRAGRKEYRNELARERRARGAAAKGKDVSHVKGGGFKLESPSKNRARNGHGKNGRLANGKGTRKSKK